MQKRGFTLIEILVSVTIIAVLSAIGVASYSSVNKRSRDAKRKSDLEQVRSALEMYRAETGAYPASGSFSGLTTSLPVLVPNYLPAIPTDPKGSQYRYRSISTNNYCLCGSLETLAGSYSECTLALPNPGCNYGLKNP